jgi:cytochrome c2
LHGPEVAEGERLVESLACRRCHEIGGAGNRLATSLDRVVWKREQSALTRSIREPVENMPRFGLGVPQTEVVIASLLHRGKRANAASAYRVHFTRQSRTASPFEELCGGCHRALLPRGPAGRAAGGPNLSGLFTRAYPRTAPGGTAWTPASLRQWLRTPVAVRPAATMRPIPLDDAQWSALRNEMGE